MSEDRIHTVSVDLAGDDDATLLRLVSTLHRRGVRVVEATLSQPLTGASAFGVAFVSTPEHARVTAASLCNLVEVVRVDMHAGVSLSDLVTE